IWWNVRLILKAGLQMANACPALSKHGVESCGPNENMGFLAPRVGNEELPLYAVEG
ncbi:hypothetical protein A4A49_64605, partial [Nicotiana attenuata]